MDFDQGCPNFVLVVKLNFVTSHKMCFSKCKIIRNHREMRDKKPSLILQSELLKQGGN